MGENKAIRYLTEEFIQISQESKRFLIEVQKSPIFLALKESGAGVRAVQNLAGFWEGFLRSEIICGRELVVRSRRGTSRAGRTSRPYLLDEFEVLLVGDDAALVGLV